MNHIKFLSLASIGLSIVLLSACGGGKKDPAAELAALKDQKAQLDAQITALEKQVGTANGQTARVKTIGLTQAQSGVFRHFIDLQGKVDADESVPATAKMPGTLKRVYVKNGDDVRRGQLLAEIEDNVMQSSLREIEGQLATATDIYNRQKGLWDQKIGTEVALIQAKNNKEGLERSIATLKENIGQTKIYAPNSGTVDLVLLKQGQVISPGMPLCNILNLTNLKIKGEVTEAYASKVRKGDQVQVMFPDLKKEITSRVTFVSKTINPTTRTFIVECALPNAADYRANQVAVMKIVDYQNPNAISVPVNVIQTAQDGEFVMIAEKTGEKTAVAKKASIKQGSNYNGQVEVLSGLKKGDWIITTGFQDVNNGETVAF
ncbi:MAG TPA: efflux RND transporter periplasmic adaptor subunit [Saprospiraceae bacterium]|nr:efflux RND transporter periplasmic adaptor subunit [Saprospiraceae bacterium]HPI07030.1 efflux RND transporter periplasmic adaptor subunit [Saprospiraceae bacterium]